MKQKVFILVDCNNFFVSCERLFQPRLKHKPVVVLSNNDGCVISRSNKAKALGIPMGAPAFQYRGVFQRHGVVVLSSNFGRYGDMSQRVMQTLATFSTDLEVYSVDEAFLEVSRLPTHDYARLARDIKGRVEQWTGIPVAVGVAPTKTLAKAAVELAKRRVELQGTLNLVGRGEHVTDAYLEVLPIEEVWGVGRRWSPRLRAVGITNAKSFKQAPQQWVQRQLKLTGMRTWQELRGVSCFPLEQVRQNKQSIAVTRSFREAKTELFELEQAVASFAARAANNLRRQGSVAGRMAVFIQTGRHSRGPAYKPATVRQLPEATAYTPRLIREAIAGVQAMFEPGYRYKRAGIILTGIAPRPQANLLKPVSKGQFRREQRLSAAMDTVNRRWGSRVLRSAAEGVDNNVFRARNRAWRDLPVVKV